MQLGGNNEKAAIASPLAKFGTNCILFMVVESLVGAALRYLLRDFLYAEG